MSEVYKIIHPIKYFTDYLNRKVRPDGREFHDQRNIKINVGSIKNAEASALVKYGNTTTVCGIKLELACPKAEEPNFGFLVTNVELPPICSPKFKPGPPSDYAQVINNLVSEIIVNSKFVDLTDLCIVPGKLAWVVFCDIICIDYDGSIIDACITSLISSLKSLYLPTVSYDIETENIEVKPNDKKQLKVLGLPVATSFAVYNHEDGNGLLLDPTAYEEEMCGGYGSNLIVCCNKNNICATQKFGGSNLTTESHEVAAKLAKERVCIIEKVIEMCLKDDKDNKNKAMETYSFFLLYLFVIILFYLTLNLFIQYLIAKEKDYNF